MKKKDKLLLSRLLLSGVERSRQVINKTIKDEVSTVEKMTTQWRALVKSFITEGLSKEVTFDLRN